MWNVPVSGSLIKYFYKESLKNKRKNTYFNSKTGFFPVNKDFFFNWLSLEKNSQYVQFLVKLTTICLYAKGGEPNFEDWRQLNLYFHLIMLMEFCFLNEEIFCKDCYIKRRF